MHGDLNVRANGQRLDLYGGASGRLIGEILGIHRVHRRELAQVGHEHKGGHRLVHRGTCCLQDALDAAITNPLTQTLDAADFNITDLGNLTLTEKASDLTPPAGQGKIYANTDGTLRYISGTTDYEVFTSPATTSLDMNTNRITGLQAATGPTDAVNLDQLNTVEGDLQGQINTNSSDIQTNVQAINANATGVAGNMTFKGNWVQQTYDSQDVVTQESWLMIANKETTDRAAPQPIGDEFYVYGLDDLIQKQDSQKSLLFGQRYS